MLKNHRVHRGAVVAAAAVVVSLVAARGRTAGTESSAQFDLAVQEMTVKQLSSTPMFRRVEISCVVNNLGPRISDATAWLLISRPGSGATQVMLAVPVPKRLEPGSKFHARAEAFAWGATSVPYRCEVQFGGANSAGDADAANDFAELTFPKF